MMDKKEPGYSTIATPPSLKIPQGTINPVINLKPESRLRRKNREGNIMFSVA
jgi:hypothetical protein